MDFVLFSLLAVLVGLARTQTSDAVLYPCPFQGLTYPRPTNIADASAITAAIQNTTTYVEEALGGGLVDNKSTAFSLTGFSTSDPDAVPFYTYHHTAPAIANGSFGVRQVDSETVYRLGSISKVITVYTLLVADGFKHFQSSISQFLPRLSGHGTEAITTTDWDDITLQSLASHMGGIGTECEPLQRN